MAGSGSVLSKIVKPKNRPQSTDIQAAAAWGVAAFTSAVWIIHLHSNKVDNDMLRKRVNDLEQNIVPSLRRALKDV